MKIKTIRLYDIEVIQDNTLIYQDKVENAPEDVLECDIKSLDFNGNCLKIHI